MTECLSFRSINPIAELFYLNLHVFIFLPISFFYSLVIALENHSLFKIVVSGIFVFKRVAWSLTPRLAVY